MVHTLSQSRNETNARQSEAQQHGRQVTEYFALGTCQGQRKEGGGFRLVRQGEGGQRRLRPVDRVVPRTEQASGKAFVVEPARGTGRGVLFQPFPEGAEEEPRPGPS